MSTHNTGGTRTQAPGGAGPTGAASGEGSDLDRRSPHAEPARQRTCRVDLDVTVREFNGERHMSLHDVALVLDEGAGTLHFRVVGEGDRGTNTVAIEGEVASHTARLVVDWLEPATARVERVGDELEFVASPMVKGNTETVDVSGKFALCSASAR